MTPLKYTKRIGRIAACMKLGSGRPGRLTKNWNGNSRKKGSQTFRKAASRPWFRITQIEIRVATKMT
jgi:hypothetical protein